MWARDIGPPPSWGVGANREFEGDPRLERRGIINHRAEPDFAPSYFAAAAAAFARTCSADGRFVRRARTTAAISTIPDR